MRENDKTNLERMRELIDQLTEADIAYYKNDAPIMTDLEYDRLTEELVSLERDTGLVLSGSPTQKVSGAILESLAEVRHTKPMLSASKTKSIEEMVRFAAGRSVMLSWKMDGLTLVLRYESGELKQAITRGREGIIGEDVTHTVRTFRNVPLTIPTEESFEVRGEGVISWESFRKINADLEEPYLLQDGKPDELMQLKESSFINILGRLDEDVWEDSTTHEKKSAMVVILDEIEYCSSGGGKQKTEETGEQSKAAAVSAKAASNGEMPGNFTGFEPFGGVNSFFDE